jgi:fructokinase
MAGSRQFAIGIDLGGTKIEAALVRNDGHILRSQRKHITRSFEGLKKDFHEIITAVHQDEPLIGIGCGIPGSLDPKTQHLRNAPNNPEINGTDFFVQLKKEFDLPILYDNDANCLVRSEHLFGVLKNCQTAVGIILGSGVGGGVLLNGKVFHSHRGLAPELGHTLANVNGRRCLCGNKGCVESFLCGPAILARYHEAGGDQSVAQTKEIFERVESDKVAQQIVQETKEIFSRFIAAIVAMYDPEKIVLGGGLAHQKIFYECQDLIAKYIFGSNEPPPVVFAQHGDASGKLGAAAMWF